MSDRPVALAEACDAALFGGKASKLAAAAAAGLPVPDGFALAWPFVDRVAREEGVAIEALADTWARLGGRAAVRSSAVGEDSAEASFAGVHVTVLNVASERRLREAVVEVRASAHADSARAYRAARLAGAEPRVGVVVQRLVEPEISGVLFTRHPVTRADERVIEATWGLGEALVGGLVTPDHVRVDRQGRVLELRIGEKDLLIRAREEGGTEEVVVDPERAAAACLDDARRAELLELASRCEALFGAELDLEWCFAGGRLHLLQHRPLTA